MSDEFESLRERLWPTSAGEIHAAEAVPSGPVKRLLAAQKDASGSDKVVLLRHVLRHASEERNGVRQQLRVAPDEWPLPPEALRKAGLTCEVHPQGGLLISAQPWRPEWIKDSEKGLDGDAAATVERRQFRKMPGDPFLSTFGFRGYTCAGQKAAVRAVVTAPEGSVLIVNLPTGAGKSLCAYVAGLIDRVGETGTTIVVVPTVALALDQERALAVVVGHRTAYVGGRSEENRRRQAEIRRRVLDGTQQILFTAPENLLTSLRSVLYEAGSKGLLKALVIDEAHIAQQWGDGFRTSFQLLPGLYRGLRRASGGQLPLSLLSATFTPECVDVLLKLFCASNAEMASVSYVFLRPEPSYWTCEVPAADKVSRLLEAVWQLPRPLILYTTKVKDAKDWFDRIRGEGFARVGLMTGESTSSERETLIQEWRADELDIVVGTSAFGLGIDKSDVRSIVHACVPETFDRYYQEVGRAGRDGRSCIALCIYSDYDLAIAKSMVGETLIGVDRGYSRWKRMYGSRQSAEGDPVGKISVKTGVPPGISEDDFDMRGRLNVQWNLKTLCLLARSGLLEFDDSIPISSGDADDAEALSRITLQLRDGINDLETWKQKVDPVRAASYRASERQYQLLKDFLEGRVCAGQVFSEAYSVPRLGVEIDPSCSGCPNCRSLRRNVWLEPPAPKPAWAPQPNVGNTLQRFMVGHDCLILEECPGNSLAKEQKLVRALRFALQQGVRLLVASEDEAKRLCSNIIHGERTSLLVDSRYTPEDSPAVPTFVVLRGQSIPRVVATRLQMEAQTLLPATIFFVEQGAMWPGDSKRGLLEMATCPKMNIEEFLIRVGQ